MRRGDSATPPPRSLIDRLINDGPSGGRPARMTTAQGLRDLHESVRRELENLLNTRWRCTSWPPDLEELEHSLVNYGIPDFTGASFNDPGSQREFRRILESAIRRFEPRFGRVKVTLVEREGPGDRTMRFRIDGLLRTGDSPEQVTFETALDPTTSTFRVGNPGR